MKNFWKWMKEKGYSSDSYYDEKYNSTSFENYIVNTNEEFTKEMLIGYMFKYIVEKGYYFELETKLWFDSFDRLYKILKEIIKKIEE